MRCLHPAGQLMADCRVKNIRNVREYWPRCAPFDKAKPAGEDPAIDAALAGAPL
jgi:hypothetical protein